MKRCQSCGYPITGRAREVTPHSDAVARPTLYLHATTAECTAAKRERMATPARRRS